jgi:hypothetical protein
MSLTERVRRHLQASDAISLLNEFCQKTTQPLPVWSCSSAPKNGSYEHAITLKMANHVFSHRGMASKSDCKKCVAEQAVAFFETKRLPFFLNRPHNHISLLQSLCQQNGMPVPDYQVVVENQYYKGEVNIGTHFFASNPIYQKKQAAKDGVASIAFAALCQMPEFTTVINCSNHRFFNSKLQFQILPDHPWFQYNPALILKCSLLLKSLMIMLNCSKRMLLRIQNQKLNSITGTLQAVMESLHCIERNLFMMGNHIYLNIIPLKLNLKPMFLKRHI